MNEQSINALKNWFLKTKRNLPWRDNPTPYSVWISEIMLQQTQVAVVLPYFLRWMDKFPTIQTLAEASVDEVIKMWEGLGYYSRARNIHAGAKYIIEHFNGQIPDNETQLKQIKGIGPYTLGAILSFAYHKKIAAIDGNVLRVIARFFGYSDDIAKIKTNQKFKKIVEDFLPDQESWIVNEALIELGATICQKKAKCYHCPLRENCISYKEDLIDQLPIKTKGPKTTYLYRAVPLFNYENKYLVKRGEKGKVMADLYEFPFIDLNSSEDCPKQLLKIIIEQFNISIDHFVPLAPVKHSFTRFQVTLNPFFIQTKKIITRENCEWITWENLKKLPFSSGHRRILANLENFHTESFPTAH